MWPDRRILDLLGIELPILLAPMAGPGLAELAIAVAEAGGLGAIPAATLSVDQVRAEVGTFRAATARPLNLNFFCHEPPAPDPDRDAAWRARIAPLCAELGVDGDGRGVDRAPFDAERAALVEQLRPEVVSFHFGLPAPDLLARVVATGARVLGSATTVAEAVWLAARGVDAVIAQGAEAGGHRGTFLTEAIAACATQPGTFALVPQVADAVSIPVIAAGGIGDGRGIAAAFALGAAAAQLGTAYLFCPEAKVPAPHRAALAEVRDDTTALTNVFTGRPARGIINRAMRELGRAPTYLAPDAPAFPLAGHALAPVKAAAEATGSGQFGSLWSGQAGRLGRALPAGALTRALADDARAQLARLAGPPLAVS